MLAILKRCSWAIILFSTMGLATVVFGQTPSWTGPAVKSDHDQIVINTQRLGTLERSFDEVKSEHTRITWLLIANLAAVATHLGTRVLEYRIRKNGATAERG